MRYLPLTETDRRAMLQAIGVPSIDSLYRDVPAAVRLKAPVELPHHLGELEVEREFQAYAAANLGTSSVPAFLGAGAYRHHIPASVDHLIQRGEFLTSYTPYQPEVSQGTLQYLFEFQTQVALITGMEVANASMYDGASATAEAALMAVRLTGRRKVIVSAALHPNYRRVLRTYLASTSNEVVTIPYDLDGRTELEGLGRALDAGTAAVILGYPNFLGVVDRVDEASKLASKVGALSVAVTTEAVSLGLLKGPGELGADVATGTFQSFGNPLNFGGPAPGFFATRDAHIRQMPGRLCGATVDKRGRRGFVLTLSTREQHIRREKATSNICTNAGLCALAATIHLALLGRRGLHDLARLNHARGVALREAMKRAGFGLLFRGPTFNEMAFEVGDGEAVVARLASRGLAAGVPLGRLYPDDPRLKGGLLCAATELHSPELIAMFARAVREAREGA